MFRRLLLTILLGFLVFGAAAAQDPRGSEKNLRLKGVLISSSGGTALIGGRALQAGDRVGGAEILAIEQRGIRILIGERELDVNVGGTFDAGYSTIRKAPAVNSYARHAVKSGETLSGIALRHKQNGVSLDQMMIALFHSNPDAFDNNINLLHKGAVLKIPSKQQQQQLTGAMAAAVVARHAENWRPADPQPVRMATAPVSKVYGPVKRGDTLSAIASRVSRDGISMNQMMVALYQANPQAFDGNINLLQEGAVLILPDENELARHTAATATAEVMRQTKLWRSGAEQHAGSKLDPAKIMAAADVPQE